MFSIFLATKSGKTSFEHGKKYEKHYNQLVTTYDRASAASERSRYWKFGADRSIRLENIEEKREGGLDSPPSQARVNPISGRLLATPISGRGGLFRAPLDISRSNGPIFKIQTAFDSTQRDLHF